MRKLLVFALTAFLGCKAGGGGGGGEGGAGAGIAQARTSLEQWVASSWLAHDTRTHATDQSPRAQAEADRIEAQLKAADPADVRVALRDRIASTKSARDAGAQRRNSLMVVGRAHTDQDKAEIERLNESIRRFEREEGMLADLGKRLGV